MAARGSGTVVWVAVFGVAPVVGATGAWVWPSTGGPDTEPGQSATTPTAVRSGR